MEIGMVRGPHGQCYRCGGAGHIARDCPSPEEETAGPSCCDSCGGRGHGQQDCWKNVRRQSLLTNVVKRRRQQEEEKEKGKERALARFMCLRMRRNPNQSRKRRTRRSTRLHKAQTPCSKSGARSACRRRQRSAWRLGKTGCSERKRAANK
ncbi:unnamed protein product [Polarella glacialis]|uniref:CCHC-type domain-containing protein n=1 Tax=Polarella glacialis TaxID=89957 RepID=A0A813HJ36_POLGL|nr:unnamed protein product [Polarella glacialis]